MLSIERRNSFARLLPVLLCCATCLLAATPSQYVVTNLVSNVDGVADHTDPHLVSGVGLTRGPSGGWWLTAMGLGEILAYDGTGYAGSNPLIIAVQVPPGGGQLMEPAGIVLNPSGDFQISRGKPAVLLTGTQNGTINGWNPLVSPAHAVVTVNATAAQANYTGLALARLGSYNLLYAANFRCGCVEAYNKNFARVNFAPSAFVDPEIPAGYGPFNIQNINGLLFVTYAQQDATGTSPVLGPGLGYISIFKTNGTFVSRLQYGGWMNAPRGIALAPATGFGTASGLLLVGMYGSGNIIGFDLQTGAAAAILRDSAGDAITVPGVAGLGFGNDDLAGPRTTLYFNSGAPGLNQGLFGTVTLAAPLASDPR